MEKVQLSFERFLKKFKFLGSDHCGTDETLHGASAQEAARRSPTGSSALRESEVSATKRVAWNGNHLHFD